MDDWVTPASTFSYGWKTGYLQVGYLLDRHTLQLDRLAAVSPAVDSLRLQAGAAQPPVTVNTGVDQLISTVVEGQRQALIIVPLLMGQLALLFAVVLALVAAAAVDQRRPELALTRLRGRTPSDVTRMLMSELGTAVTAGVPVGLLVAAVMGYLARHLWLTPGVPFEVPGGVWVAAALSLAAGLAAVVLVSRSTIREPVITLLRRIPPRTATIALRVLDAVIVAVAVAGIITLASGNLSGPLALATPTLLALSAGLVLAILLVPAANATARRVLLLRRPVGLLSTVQLARRPAVRQVLTIVTVATALTVFAADANTIGSRNRDQRAQAESGAAAVLVTDATDVGVLKSAVTAADPTGRVATPVARIVQPGVDALTTLAVVPDQFSAVALLPRDAASFDWARIAAPTASDVVVTGGSLSITVSDIHLSNTQATSTTGAPVLANLNMYLAPAGQAPFEFTVGAFPISEPGPVTLATRASCSEGCRVTALGVSLLPGQQGRLAGTLTLGGLATTGAPAAVIGRADQWRASGGGTAGPSGGYARPVNVNDPTKVGLSTDTDGARITSVSSTTPVPAMVVGALPGGGAGPDFQAAGLDGISTPMTQLLRAPYAPGGGANVAIVALDALRLRTTHLVAGQGQVWISDTQHTGAVTTALTRAHCCGPSLARYRCPAAPSISTAASSTTTPLPLVPELPSSLKATGSPPSSPGTKTSR